MNYDITPIYGSSYIGNICNSLTQTTIIRMLARVQRSNTGAPQGDILSPALYVIYMEVVPLQLERYIGTILSRRHQYATIQR